jgi:hypothetical protein
MALSTTRVIRLIAKDKAFEFDAGLFDGLETGRRQPL